MASTQRQKLIYFINRKVFDPVLRADASRYNDHDKEVLHDVQDRTRKEKERFEKEYTSAGQVKENYLSDVNSEAAKKVDRQLRQLHLPTLPQHRDGFEDLCNRLGV